MVPTFLPERSEGKKPLEKSYGLQRSLNLVLMLSSPGGEEIVFFVELLFQSKILVQEE